MLAYDTRVFLTSVCVEGRALLGVCIQRTQAKGLDFARARRKMLVSVSLERATESVHGLSITPLYAHYAHYAPLDHITPARLPSARGS